MRTFCFLLFLATELIAVRSQEFINFGFELADTNSILMTGLNAGSGPASEMIPGWTLSRNGQRVDWITFNNVAVPGGGGGVIFDNTRIPGMPSEGKFGLELVDTPQDRERYTLVQRGDVPGWAELVVFTYLGLPFDLKVNGQSVPTKNPGRVSTPTTVVADFSMWAGQNVELSFQTAGQSPFGEAFGPHLIDDIRFNVPEPSTFLLSTVGGVLLLWRLWRTRIRWQ